MIPDLAEKLIRSLDHLPSGHDSDTQMQEEKQMFDASRFFDIIRENNGFEVTLGFRDDVDHFIGGTGNKIWYFIRSGKTEDYFICTVEGSVYSDVHYTRKGKKLKAETADPGKTLDMILAELTTGQTEIEEKSRNAVNVDICGHACSHYSFSFGERAYRISDEYGMTVEYSNINDEKSGFRLRNITTGPEVHIPSEK